MAWNKWKVGWFDDHDFGCLASDGTAEYNLSPSETPLRRRADQEGRRGPHRPDHGDHRRAARAARQRRHVRGTDRRSRLAAACATGACCSTSSTSPSSTPTGRSRSSTTMPRSTAWGCTRDVDIATLGQGQGDGPSHFEDPETGTVIERAGDRRRGRHRDPARDPRDHPHHRHDSGVGAVHHRRSPRAAGAGHVHVGRRRRRGATTSTRTFGAGTHTVADHPQRRHGDQDRSRSTRRPAGRSR